jgi:hypothetical protein
MGLAKQARIIGCLGWVAVVLLAAGTACSNKRTTVSSQSFLAPQLTGDTPTAQGAEIQVSKLDVLRAALQSPDKTWLDSELLALNARLTFVSKLDGDRDLVFESISKTVLAVSNSAKGGSVQRVMTYSDIVELLAAQVTKPSLAPAVLLDSGWVLIYEGTAKELFAVRPDPANPASFIKTLVLTQKGLQTGLFQTTDDQGNTTNRIVQPWPQVTVQNMIKFTPPTPDGKDHILLVPGNTNLPEFEHLEISWNADNEAIVNVPEPKPFLDFPTQISSVTQNLQVEVKTFPPIAIPGTSSILLFDSAASAFLQMNLENGTDNAGNPAMVTSIDVMTSRADILNAMKASASGGETFDGTFNFTSSFLGPNGTRIYAYDDETKTIFTYDYAAGTAEADRIGIITTSTMLTSRRDFNFDIELDSAVYTPSPQFAGDDVVNNKLAWDTGASQLISINYESGQVVVVLHKRDLTAVTQNGTLDLNHISTLDPPPAGEGKELRVIDAESCSIIALHLDYIAVPVKAP